MEEFVISPPATILWAAGAVLVVAVVGIAFTKGSFVRKGIRIAIVLLVLAVLLAFVYRPVTIRVDADGLSISGAGGAELPWSQVTSAVYVRDLRSSSFRPTVRTRGFALGEYRAGRFLLSNGEPAQVFMEQSRQAVVVRTAQIVYLLGPHDVAGLARAIDTYRVY